MATERIRRKGKETETFVLSAQYSVGSQRFYSNLNEKVAFAKATQGVCTSSHRQG